MPAGFRGADGDVDAKSPARVRGHEGQLHPVSRRLSPALIGTKRSRVRTVTPGRVTETLIAYGLLLREAREGDAERVEGARLPVDLVGGRS